MWVLRSTDDSGRYTLRLALGAERTVGRGPRADFVVDVALVSRVHCHLSTSDSGLAVEDLRSTNGTFVNDKRIRQSPLRVGDRLRLGRLELSVSEE